MKTNLNATLVLSLLTVALPYAGRSTVFFADNFSNGSTTNQTSAPTGTATASATSYDLASSKNADVSTIAPGLLSLKLSTTTTSGFWEAQALFATNPVVLASPGDNVTVTIVFTNTLGALLPGIHSPLWIGLYNSASAPTLLNPPVAGALGNAGLTTSAGSPYATGNCELWQGYVGQVYNGVAGTIVTRPVQNQTGTTSANQELLGNEVSSTAYSNPKGSTLATSSVQSYTVASNSPYTAYLSITLDPAGTGNLIVSNALFAGAGTGGACIFSNAVNTSTVLATAFDGLAFGAFDHETASLNPQMDVSLITVSGQSTVVHSPPNITTEPVSVNVVSGGSCAFYVTATGQDVTYQWHRGGTNLVNGGNIGGATSSMLTISPAGPADVLSGANGYYVTVTGAGDYSTNSTTNSLSLIASTSLTWSGSSVVWDVATTADWVGSKVFNYGDPVTFDNTGGGGEVNLSAPYLSPLAITVNSDDTYTFDGTGSIAGPTVLNYIGAGQLTMDANNTYSGGTIVSNSLAYVYLEDYQSLGAGPVTFAKAGASLEIVPSGNVGVGINGDIVAADDCEVFLDTAGNYGGVFLGNFSGTSGKTLTFALGGTNGAQTRVRAYGNNTVDNANLNLSSSQILFAPYQANGSQTYNGVISGSGAVMQKASTTTYLTAQNTYSGGTYVPQGTLALGSDSTGSITSGPIGTGPLYLAPDSTTTTTGNGAVMASGSAHTIANPIQYPTGTNNLTLVVGGSNNLTFTGAFTLNGNDRVTTNTFTSRAINVTNTALTTFAGVISDGGLNYGLNLTGVGILALNNTETYTGPTTVTNGTLQVNSSLAAGSAVTVYNTGTLAGTGAVNGAVTIQSGGNLAPGDQGIGTLTVNNSVTMQAGSSNIIEINAAANTHDTLSANSIAFSGTLFATNISGTSPSVGASYTIYTGTKSGNFSAIAGTPGPGLAWNFNATSGVLSVAKGVATNPTNILYSVSSGAGGSSTLSLSWPTDHTGWTLQTETNLSTTNWANVAGSSNTNMVNISISATNSQQYYRLIYVP